MDSYERDRYYLDQSEKDGENLRKTKYISDCSGFEMEDVVFEIVDPYSSSAQHSPLFMSNLEGGLSRFDLKDWSLGPSASLEASHDELFSLMQNSISEMKEHEDKMDSKYPERFAKEIDVYALVPENPISKCDGVFQRPVGTRDVVEATKWNNKQSAHEESFDVDSLYALLEEKRKTMAVNVNITALAVTTQSAKATMNQHIELKHMASILRDSIVRNIDNEEREDFSIRGVLYKDIHAGEIRKPKPTKAGQFPNNCSVLIRSPMGTGRHVNIKIFQGGSLTMTGCLVKEDGIAAIKILEQYLRKQKVLFGGKEKARKFKIHSFNTTMVNSGYSLGFDVDRVRLYEFLSKETGLNVSYAPETYAGVKISFYYNSANDKKDGICHCPGSPCTGDKTSAGKGTGDKIGQCKRVTIAIFESGKVIDTGGRNMTHALAAYNYVNDILEKNAQKFVKIDIEDIISTEV